MGDAPPTREALVADLSDLLDVEEIDTNLYRGRRATGGVGRVFGGQVVAQALQAAQRSAPPAMTAHSLHAGFMRPGSEDHPILYHVTRDFDGRTFGTRRVVATQRSVPILTLTASFQRAEEGLAHQDAMPDVPPPETLADEASRRAALASGLDERFRRLLPRAVEVRRVAPGDWPDPAPAPPFQCSWLRAVAPLGDDPALHRAVIAYASDMALLATSMLPHGVTWMTPGLQSASLDHALWLHEPARADDWLLYAMDSPWAGHGRGLNRGRIFTRDGRLVASVAQEGLIRLRR